MAQGFRSMVNFGVCEACGFHNPPRSGDITCENCGERIYMSGSKLAPSWLGMPLYAPGIVIVAVVAAFVLLSMLV